MILKVCGVGFTILFIAFPVFPQTKTSDIPASTSPSATKVMMTATDLGVGGIAFHRFGRPSTTNFIFGTGMLSAIEPADVSVNGVMYSQRAMFIPLRFGIRNEIYHQELSSLDWAFYWVGTLGPVLAFGYPRGLDFRQTFSHFNFGLGGEVYSALGLEASFGAGVSLYLEGGAYAMNAFASRSLFQHANYIGPSLAFGIRTGF